MLTKGFGLIEALLALLLGSVILTAALTCQWFARRAMQVSIEQMTAVHLLIDISHSTDFTAMPPGQPLMVSAQPCVSCNAATLHHASIVQQLFQQPLAAMLVHPQLCVDIAATGVQLVLSWQSSVPPSGSYPQACGSGTGRRQVILGRG